MPSSHQVCFASLRSDAGRAERDVAHAQRALLLQRRRQCEEERCDQGEDLGHGAEPTPVRRERHNAIDEVEPLGTMGDEEDRALARGVEHVCDERLGGRAVEMRRRLVDEKHGSVREERSRDDEALSLAARELRPLLADVACRDRPAATRPNRPAERARARRAARRPSHPGRASRRFSRIVESKTCASWPASANVRADVLLPEIADIDAVDRDATRLRIEEAQEEVRHRRLPRAARADERDARTRARSGGRSS